MQLEEAVIGCANNQPPEEETSTNKLPKPGKELWRLGRLRLQGLHTPGCLVSVSTNRTRLQEIGPVLPVGRRGLPI